MISGLLRILISSLAGFYVIFSNYSLQLSEVCFRERTLNKVLDWDVLHIVTVYL